MSLTKTTQNDKIEIVNLAAGYPVLQVRKATIISENDVEINRTFERYVLGPLDDLTNEPSDVTAIANAVFTSDAIAAAQAVVDQG